MVLHIIIYRYLQQLFCKHKFEEKKVREHTLDTETESIYNICSKCGQCILIKHSQTFFAGPHIRVIDYDKVNWITPQTPGIPPAKI